MEFQKKGILQWGFGFLSYLVIVLFLCWLGTGIIPQESDPIDHVPDLGAGEEMIIEVGTENGNEITVEIGTRVGGREDTRGVEVDPVPGAGRTKFILESIPERSPILVPGAERNITQKGSLILVPAVKVRNEVLQENTYVQIPVEVHQ